MAKPSFLQSTMAISGAPATANKQKQSKVVKASLRIANDSLPTTQPNNTAVTTAPPGEQKPADAKEEKTEINNAALNAEAACQM